MGNLLTAIRAADVIRVDDGPLISMWTMDDNARAAYIQWREDALEFAIELAYDDMKATELEGDHALVPTVDDPDPVKIRCYTLRSISHDDLETSGWPEIDGHPVEDWMTEVTNGDTRLGYAEWVAHRAEDQANDENR